MASDTLHAINPAAARALAADTRRWSATADDIGIQLAEALTLCQIPCTAELLLDQISSDTRTIATAVDAATEHIESHLINLSHTAFDTPTLGRGGDDQPGSETEAPAHGSANLQSAIEEITEQFAVPPGNAGAADQLADGIGQIRDLLDKADLVEHAAGQIPDYWWYAKEGSDAEAHRLRGEAWRAALALGLNPLALIGALSASDDEADASLSDQELAQGIQLQHAQRLFATAQQLDSPGFAFEREQLRQEIRDILDRLYPREPDQAILDAAGATVAPLTLATIISYSNEHDRDGIEVARSTDPLRVLELHLLQGYTEDSALHFVATAPTAGTGAMTYTELEIRLAELEALGATETDDYNDVLQELNDRTSEMAVGANYATAELQAVRIVEQTGLGYGDALAALIANHLESVGGPPNAQAEQMTAIGTSLVLLVKVRNAEAIEDYGTGLASQPGSTGMDATLDPPELFDPEEQAARLAAMISAGASLQLAEALNPLLEGAMHHELARVARDITALEAAGHDLGDAATVAIGALQLGWSIDDVTDLLDDRTDLIAAWERRAGAHMRDMTIEEFDAYQGFVEIFDLLDGIQGGDADSIVSRSDLDYVINNWSNLNLDHSTVLAAHAFSKQRELMIRLDTAGAFDDDVVSHASFGRTDPDDYRWSWDDINGFELKQGINFALQGLVDTIDTASQGGDPDEHLSKIDFQAVVDSAEELGLTSGEIDAINVVIDGRLYDKPWREEHRDSIVLATAIIAGITISLSSLGTATIGAAALIKTVLAAAAYSGTSAAIMNTVVNATTDEDLGDGLVTNTITGAAAGGLIGPSVAVGATGLAAASTDTGVVANMLGLLGEGAGIVSTGAMDWAIAPVTGGDEIDLENLHEMAAQASFALEGLGLANGAAAASLANRFSPSDTFSYIDNGVVKTVVLGLTPDEDIRFEVDAFELDIDQLDDPDVAVIASTD